MAQVQNAPQFNPAYNDALQLRTLVKGGSVVPNWLDDHRFCFEDVTVAGPNAFIVDPAATAAKMEECQWLKPELVGQFEFTEWTPDNHLRHSRFVALREDKKARDVVREV